ncbi:MAG: trimethylamine methyltransferase family protein, partial [Chloroflexota bacterium]
MSRERRRSRRRANVVEVEKPKAPVVQPGTVGGWYKPLKDPDIEKIHNAALDVLQNIGVEVLPSEARDIFEKAGAKINPDKNRVYIPRELVNQALATAQNEVLMAGRDPKHDMLLGGQRVYMGTGGAAVKILDFETGHVRETTLKDVAEVGRLTDALDNIHFYLRCCVARDLSNELLDINTFYASIINTTKHVTGNAFTPESVREIVELGTLIMGGREQLRERPILSFTNCWTVSPLRFAP